MDLILQRGLPHQQKAVDAVAGVFADVPLTQTGGAYSYANPKFNLLDSRLAVNVAAMQASISGRTSAVAIRSRRAF